MNTATKEIADILTNLRHTIPLVHNITNYVTVNGVANGILAIGGSPIMADDIEETSDITRISSALVLNIGTLNNRTVASMLASGKAANEAGIPVVFDPVGAGASELRNQVTMEILQKVKITILRGNLSEISFIAGLKSSTKGVDSSVLDEKNDGVAMAKALSCNYNCVTAITGAIDIISDGKRILKIHNGNPMLSKVTGTGCMTTGLVGAYAGAVKKYIKTGIDVEESVNREKNLIISASDRLLECYLYAAAGGVASMAIAGELSYAKYGQVGTGSFFTGILDALSCLDSSTIIERADIREE